MSSPRTRKLQHTRGADSFSSRQDSLDQLSPMSPTQPSPARNKERKQANQDLEPTPSRLQQMEEEHNAKIKQILQRVTRPQHLLAHPLGLQQYTKQVRDDHMTTTFSFKPEETFQGPLQRIINPSKPTVVKQLLKPLTMVATGVKPQSTACPRHI